MIHPVLAAETSPGARSIPSPPPLDISSRTPPVAANLPSSTQPELVYGRCQHPHVGTSPVPPAAPAHPRQQLQHAGAALGPTWQGERRELRDPVPN